MRKIFGSESGQAIAEFAVMLPVFVMVSFCLIDIQWMTKQAANIDYISTEVARCEALLEEHPNAPLRCNPANSGVPAHQYAVSLARDLRLDNSFLTVQTPPCDSNVGTCTVTMHYDYHALGVWFPAVAISRTGTASFVAP